MKSLLYSPLRIRELEVRNRIFVSPMCQYSAIDGIPQQWHMVHLGSRAVGGAGLVMAEATAVSPEGRITPSDTGIWNETQQSAWRMIAHFIREQGAAPAIQLAHAGRKASTSAPWLGGKALLSTNEGGWTVLAPSAVPFNSEYPMPKELTKAEIAKLVTQFAEAAERALQAGFEAVEIHMAHGYLLHSFLSPLSNLRKDEFGGSLENRMRFPLQVASEIRKVWPARLPLFSRISATDWTEGGWDLESSVVFAKELKRIGVDLIDCSTGGNVASAKIPVAPGYQVPFAETIRHASGLLSGAVGLITRPEHAEEILANGRADVVFLARELLRDPYWPLHSAHALRADMPYPKQYERARN